MLTEKGGQGWPHLVYLNAAGDVVASPDGRSVTAFKSGLDEVAAYEALVAKANEGDADAELELFIKRVDLGHFNAAAAKARMAELAIADDAVRARLEKKLVDLEFRDFMAGIDSLEALEAKGSALADMVEGGRIPSGRAAMQFWNVVMAYADRTTRPDLFEKAIDGIVEAVGADDPRAVQFREQASARLEELRKKADGEGRDG